jgi:hypothetical protein
MESSKGLQRYIWRRDNRQFLMHTHEYFSKWRSEWIAFSPTVGELISLSKYYYQLREIGNTQTKLLE